VKLRHSAVKRLGKCLAGAAIVAPVAVGCAPEFDKQRQIPERGTAGRELYTLLCDRIGAQSLRIDVTGASFHSLCHRDTVGKYSDTVDVSLLPPLTASAADKDGNAVSMETQQANRTYQIARVEALSRRREDLIRAFDAVLPDEALPITESRAFDENALCGGDAQPAGQKRYLSVLADTLSGLVDLHNDGTFPGVTRSVGALLESVRTDPDLAEVLTRLDKRQGYRPIEMALGIAQPALSYERFSTLASSLTLLAADSEPNNPVHKGDPSNPSFYENHTPVAGDGHSAFKQILSVMREELRVPAQPDSPLTSTVDTVLGGDVLSRPRNKLEIARELLFAEHASFATRVTPHYAVRREQRGYASVRLVNDQVPSPFVDSGNGTAKLDDETGQLVTVSGKLPPAPFVTTGAPDWPRDLNSRPLGTDGEPLYDYLDVTKTLASRVVKDLRPLLSPENGTVLNLLNGLSLLLGPREAEATSVQAYPPDPSRASEYAALGEPVPANIETDPVQLRYRSFDSSQSPLVDLAYAFGTLLAHPATDPGLATVHQLAVEQPALVARLVGLGLDMKDIANAHDEAWIPENSTLWDEALDVAAKLAREPGLLEAIIVALGEDESQKLGQILPHYLLNRDDVSYYKDPSDPENYAKLNTNVNVTTGQVLLPDTPQPFSSKVDRSLADAGRNRSIFQRFLQALHDADGLAICTKEGAVAHLQVEWPANSGIVINLNYPTDFIVRLICPFVGAPMPPTNLPKCAVLRIRDVTRLIIDVLLERAEFEVLDPCLKNLMDSPLTSIVGGVDAFLENASGIDGLSLQPSIPAISRLAFFDTPYSLYGGYGGDNMYPKTRDSLKDIIDPVGTTVCRLTPHTDVDGVVLALRECDNFEDTLRSRDKNALFPVEQLGFLDALKPLARAFGDYNGTPLFVDLFVTLHLHYGSPAQSPVECDPNAPKTDGRWCSQDGLVRYEELLAEAMSGDLFPAISAISKQLQTMSVDRCLRFSAASGHCLETESVGGVKALADLIRVAVDPDLNVGLTDRFGRLEAARNDGTTNPQTTPVNLIIDSLKGIDKVFADHEAAHPEEGSRLEPWRAARSHIVDTFLSVQGTGENSRFVNPAVTELLPTLVSMLQTQIRANCPDRTSRANCDWANGGFAANVGEVLDGPILAATMDVITAINNDPFAKQELQLFLEYLVNELSYGDAHITTATALIDILQLLDDTKHLDPVFDWLAKGAAPTVRDEDGKVLTLGLIDSTIGLLSRLFASDYDGVDKRMCQSALDPHGSFSMMLQRSVTPLGQGEETPIETIMSVIADVNRSDPRETGEFRAADFRNVATEVNDFLLNPTTGLEQVYEVIRQATVAR
jgi:hypothetical protein